MHRGISTDLIIILIKLCYRIRVYLASSSDYCTITILAKILNQLFQIFYFYFTGTHEIYFVFTSVDDGCLGRW